MRRFEEAEALGDFSGWPRSCGACPAVAGSLAGLSSFADESSLVLSLPKWQAAQETFLNPEVRLLG